MGSQNGIICEVTGVQMPQEQADYMDHMAKVSSHMNCMSLKPSTHRERSEIPSSELHFLSLLRVALYIAVASLSPSDWTRPLPSCKKAAEYCRETLLRSCSLTRKQKGWRSSQTFSTRPSPEPLLPVMMQEGSDPLEAEHLGPGAWSSSWIAQRTLQESSSLLVTHAMGGILQWLRLL